MPPIGTKLALTLANNTKDLGPLSEANRSGGTTRRTRFLFFGIA